MRAILYIGHGTRSKKGADEARAFLNRVMDRIDVQVQELCFLELTAPFIEEGFRRCVEKGATEITVVPLFLLAAGHIKVDIPQELSALQTEFPQVTVDVLDPFGVQGKILDGIAELVRNAAPDLNSNDALLIVGRGSSDPLIHQAFAEITEGLRTRLGTEHVAVCYLAAAEPGLREGLDLIIGCSSGRIMVVPYLLFSGLLLNEVNQLVRQQQKQGLCITHTGPLSGHRIIEDLIIERAGE